MAEEEAAAPPPVVKGEHAVSSVLSYMDDEHEKAAIEVGLSLRALSTHAPTPHPPPPHLSSHSFSIFTLNKFGRAPPNKKKSSAFRHQQH